MCPDSYPGLALVLNVLNVLHTLGGDNEHFPTLKSHKLSEATQQKHIGGAHEYIDFCRREHAQWTKSSLHVVKHISKLGLNLATSEFNYSVAA